MALEQRAEGGEGPCTCLGKGRSGGVKSKGKGLEEGPS